MPEEDSRRTRWSKFVRDLDGREAQYLESHPEHYVCTTPNLAKRPRRLKADEVHCVDVFDGDTPGSYAVWVNKEFKFAFYGPDAHAEATRVAAQILEEGL